MTQETRSAQHACTHGTHTPPYLVQQLSELGPDVRGLDGAGPAQEEKSELEHVGHLWDMGEKGVSACHTHTHI